MSITHSPVVELRQYTLKPGARDTLVSISEATGIELDDLVALNPDIDPQALIAGQRVSLRQSGTETGFSDDGDVGAGDPADEFGDGSVDGSSSP